jgi:hypothetical protein
VKGNGTLDAFAVPEARLDPKRLARDPGARGGEALLEALTIPLMTGVAPAVIAIDRLCGAEVLSALS